MVGKKGEGKETGSNGNVNHEVMEGIRWEVKVRNKEKRGELVERGKFWRR